MARGGAAVDEGGVRAIRAAAPWAQAAWMTRRAVAGARCAAGAQRSLCRVDISKLRLKVSERSLTTCAPQTVSARIEVSERSLIIDAYGSPGYASK